MALRKSRYRPLSYEPPKWEYIGFTTSLIFPLALQRDITRYALTRVAIAEDHPEMRVALRLLLDLSEKMEVVHEASDGQEAVESVKRLKPDVLVMDVQMPVLDGFAATKQLTELALPTRIILISTLRGKFMTKQAAAAGAKGFIPKDELAKLLLQGIEAVSQGETFFVE